MEWKISEKPIGYEEAIIAMESRVESIRAAKEDEMVWLLEHPPLYTAGSSAKDSDLLNNKDFPVHATGRGGQYTYHGPGQRVAYVMLDLKRRTPDVRLFVRNLEETVILALAECGIKGQRREGRVGIWVEDGQGESKIAALGVRLKQWVSYHGVSVNINPDLSHYNGIVPCGIKEYGVTSFKQLGVKTDMAMFDKQFIKAFNMIF